MLGEQIVIAVTLIAIVLIAGVSLNSIVEKVMHAKRLRYEARPEADRQAMLAITERQQQIEDRLRVLERIATSRGTLLADEIEALRSEALALGETRQLSAAGSQ